MEDQRQREVLGELTPEELARLHDEARALRMSITHLTRTAAERRRRAVLGLAVAIWVAIWAHDQHVEQCVVSGPTSEAAEFACDVAFPLHNHSNDRLFISGDDEEGNGDHVRPRPESDFPINGNALGMVAYLTALAMGIRWAYRRHSHYEL